MFPGLQNYRYAFFLSQTACKYGVISDPLARPRVRIDEVRLHNNLVGIESGRDKLSAREFGCRDGAVHELLVGFQLPMPNKHQRDCCCFHVRVAVATMPNATPQAVLHALLADLSVTKKKSAWA